MSTIKTNNAQIGQSLTATNNFTVYQPASPDGTVRWGVGNAGSVTDIVTLDSSGNVGIGQTPTAYGSTVRNVESYIAGASGYTLVSAATASVKTEISAAESSLLGQVGTRTNHPLVVKTNDTERMRIDSSGNVGIGVTPSAWGSNVAMQMAGPSMWGNSAVSHWSTNTYFDGSNYKYMANGFVQDYYQLNGAHVFRASDSGTAGANVLTFANLIAVTKGQSVALEGASSQAGTGITFPATQSASSNANTLDDYEEGTWTPSVGGSATYGAVNTGRYTKIGNKVFIEGILEISTIGTGSQVNVSGLPFTSFNGNPQGTISVGYWQALSQAVVYLSCTIAGNGTSLNLRSTTGAAASLNALNILQNGTAIFFSGQYRTA